MSQFDEELAELLADSISVEKYTGKDSAGNPAYSAAETVECYVEPVVSRGDLDQSEAQYGPEVKFTGTFWCRPSGIGPRDRVTLPDGDVGYVLSATNYRNVPTTGPHHQEVQYAVRN